MYVVYLWLGTYQFTHIFRNSLTTQLDNDTIMKQHWRVMVNKETTNKDEAGNILNLFSIENYDNGD